MAVLLYHVKVPGFQSGYVGVDVFFVLSGYLITRILAAPERERSLHSLGDFYTRRARRILPALFAVVALTTVVAYLLLLPPDLIRFGRYVAATSLLLSNAASWAEGGYFILGYVVVALNHLWSIAVEEQFYLIYPLVLWLVLRYRPQRKLAILVGVGLVSLAVCIWASYRHPTANYYFSGSRAWELLLGAVVALSIGESSFRAPPRWAREAIAGVSLIALCAAISMYGSSVRYPGAYTLVPCLATAALLAMNGMGPTVAGRLLSLRPVVFTGLISYSLYLWHWPLLTFVKYYTIEDPGPAISVASVVAVYLLAALSWKFVEQPVRNRRVLARRSHLWWSAGAATLLLLLTGMGLWHSNGFPQRFSPEVRRVLEGTAGLHVDTYRCLTLSLAQIESGELCRYEAGGGSKRRMVIWGDSHAMALLPAYQTLARVHKVDLYVGGAPACAPLLDVVNAQRAERQRNHCADLSSAMVVAIRHLNPQYVVLNSHWNFGYSTLQPRPVFLLRPAESLFRQGLERTLKAIDAPGRTVVAMLDAPQLDYIVPYAMAMAHHRGIRDDFISIPRAVAFAQSHAVDSDIQALELRGLVHTFDLKEILCRGERCLFKSAGRPLYRDNNHISLFGADYLADALEPWFEKLVSAGP